MSPGADHLVCIDTNCLIYAFVGSNEALTREVMAFRVESAKVILPSIAHEEFANALVEWYVKVEHLPTEVARWNLDTFLRANFRIDSSNLRHREALELTLADPTLSGYDAQFLAVASHHGAELWTADRALAAKARRLGISVRRFKPELH